MLLWTLAPWIRTQQPTPVFLPRESHGLRSPPGYRSIGSQRVGHDWRDLEWTKKWILEYMYLFKWVLLFSSDIYPRVKLLGHIVVLFLVSLRNLILFSIIGSLFLDGSKKENIGEKEWWSKMGQNRNTWWIWLQVIQEFSVLFFCNFFMNLKL